jgi:hypothetical protein
MLSVRIERYHALHILCYEAPALNDLLAQIPPGITSKNPEPKPSSPKTPRHGDCGR